jgi:hypothetical protein
MNAMRARLPRTGPAIQALLLLFGEEGEEEEIAVVVVDGEDVDVDVDDGIEGVLVNEEAKQTY